MYIKPPPPVYWVTPTRCFSKLGMSSTTLNLWGCTYGVDHRPSALIPE